MSGRCTGRGAAAAWVAWDKQEGRRREGLSLATASVLKINMSWLSRRPFLSRLEAHSGLTLGSKQRGVEAGAGRSGLLQEVVHRASQLLGRLRQLLLSLRIHGSGGRSCNAQAAGRAVCLIGGEGREAAAGLQPSVFAGPATAQLVPGSQGVHLGGLQRHWGQRERLQIGALPPVPSQRRSSTPGGSSDSVQSQEQGVAGGRRVEREHLPPERGLSVWTLCMAPPVYQECVNRRRRRTTPACCRRSGGVARNLLFNMCLPPGSSDAAALLMNHHDLYRNIIILYLAQRVLAMRRMAAIVPRAGGMRLAACLCEVMPHTGAALCTDGLAQACRPTRAACACKRDAITAAVRATSCAGHLQHKQATRSATAAIGLVHFTRSARGGHLSKGTDPFGPKRMGAQLGSNQRLGIWSREKEQSGGILPGRLSRPGKGRLRGRDGMGRPAGLWLAINR